MAIKRITQRSIIGTFYEKLEDKQGLTWAEKISFYQKSDQEQESYAWLGQSPSLKKWNGSRKTTPLLENGYLIRNEAYESTLEISVDDMRRDKTGQIMIRINEQVKKARYHWAKLISDLIVSGETQQCYDGQFFFDTDHLEGASGSQSNIISVDISALPVETHGTTTAPSIAELQQSLLQGVQAIMGYKDDQGDLMSEDARSFIVQVPITLWSVAVNAVGAPVVNSSSNIVMSLNGYTFEVVSNGRLTGWTDKFAIFRTDSTVSPFIRQEEIPLEISALAEGSDIEFTNRVHQYGIYSSRAAGYGYWQDAVMVKMT